MVNIEKYRNDGWGLSKKCFLDIENLLNNFNEPNIVEFGSGISTNFFVDYLNENKKNGRIISFDNDSTYIPKIKDNKLNLVITELLECNDNDFNQMFLNRNYVRNNMKFRILPPHTRQKNCFYNIKENTLSDNIDIVIVDGPHGNGRSLSFLHVKDKLHTGSFVIIDDFTHYDFSEKFKIIFPNSELIIENKSGSVNQWDNGGDYRIYKIL